MNIGGDNLFDKLTDNDKKLIAEVQMLISRKSILKQIKTEYEKILGPDVDSLLNTLMGKSANSINSKDKDVMALTVGAIIDPWIKEIEDRLTEINTLLEDSFYNMISREWVSAYKDVVFSKLDEHYPTVVTNAFCKDTLDIGPDEHSVQKDICMQAVNYFIESLKNEVKEEEKTEQ